ncbi:tetratricopeptide repeat protein [candidate division KSB1 bacterium]|nr:tetratricopeptide repeat protein [candidate division KSB1 bacterium]
MKGVKVFVAILMIIVTMRCSQQGTVQKPAGQISAEDYYEAGLAALQQGDWEQAALSFNRAIKIAPQYANGYAGAALVLALKNQPEKAVEYAEKAVKLDKKSFDAQVSLGRVLADARADGWFERAINAFDAALALKPLDEAALYYKATVLREHKNLQQAMALYMQISSQGGAFAAKAEEEIVHINNYQLTSPRTAVGDSILRLEKINRADLAALLVSEFNIVQIIGRRNPNYAGGKSQHFQSEENKKNHLAGIISDIAGHWAESWIKDVVRVGGMDIFPDNSFRPNELVRRMNFAMTLQNIIIQVTGNNALYTAFINKPSSYADVKRTHFAYNAVCLVTEYEIMPLPSKGDRFDLDGAVSGYEALLALRNLEGYLNSSF